MKNEDHFSIIKENIKDLMKTPHQLILPSFIRHEHSSLTNIQLLFDIYIFVHLCFHMIGYTQTHFSASLLSVFTCLDEIMILYSYSHLIVVAAPGIFLKVFLKKHKLYNLKIQKNKEKFIY